MKANEYYTQVKGEIIKVTNIKGNLYEGYNPDMYAPVGQKIQCIRCKSEVFKNKKTAIKYFKKND